MKFVKKNNNLSGRFVALAAMVFIPALGSAQLPSAYEVSRMAINLQNRTVADGKREAGQGIAVRDGILYRLHNDGVCQTFDLADRELPAFVGEFRLGSFGQPNHCNAAQFDAATTSDGEGLLYVAGLSRRCYVEAVTPTGARLVQTIVLGHVEGLPDNAHDNIICGDDGCLWAFGSHSDQLYFGKFRKPTLDEGAQVTLTTDDLLDSWTVGGYVYEQSVWQGGMVRGGRLYFVFGTESSDRHIAVYDTRTHDLVENIDLNKAIPEELEDCELLSDGTLLVGIFGGKGYYVLRPQ